jgi:hypothetical protein
MKYAEPLTQTLSVIHNGKSYSHTYYKPPAVLSGVADEAYPAYDPNAIYDTEDFVIVPELKRIYKCADDGTSGVFPPSDTKKWSDFGPVNSYRMFAIDENIGASCEGENIYMEFEFNQTDTIGVIDVEFTTLHIEQVDNDTQEVLNELDIDGKDIGCLSLEEYFYAESADVTRVIIDNLAWHPNSTLKLSFAGGVKIGTFTLGNAKELGITLYGTNLEFEDRSLIAEDAFTKTRKVIRYGQVRVLSAKVLFDVEEFNLTSQKVTKIIGKNMLFIPTDKDMFNEMNNIAYIEKFALPVDDPNVIDTQMTMIGVSK